MSYFRGDIYIWASDEALHIWAQPNAKGEYKHKIAIPTDMADQLAAMRFCEMIERGEVEKAIHDASKSGNGGGLSVKQNGQQLLNRLRSMPTVKTDAYVFEEAISLEYCDKMEVNKADRSIRKSK